MHGILAVVRRRPGGNDPGPWIVIAIAGATVAVIIIGVFIGSRLRRKRAAAMERIAGELGSSIGP